jgi:hypothetical protein
MPGVAYSHDQITPGPQSVHVLKIDRFSPDLEWHTVAGKGAEVGVGTLSEQIKSLPPGLGKPIAAINGDYAKAGLQIQAHPLGLQIMRGELVCAPGKEPCFWIDTNGLPHTGVVTPQFQVTWPNEQVTVIGLNDERGNGAAMLYSAAFGASTRTGRGREIVLEQTAGGHWTPLRPAESRLVRVREVREAGNTPLSSETLVLSLSLPLLARAPKIAAGELLRISLSTSPSLAGVQTALGGGPVLLRGGKSALLSVGSDSWLERHPRTAVGWDDRFFFLVVVDGRQKSLSLGMTLPELAAYLRKLGCQEALNLDGGGSSTFWYNGQVVNHPCEGRERPMANALVLVQKPSPSSPPSSADGGAGRQETSASMGGTK